MSGEEWLGVFACVSCKVYVYKGNKNGRQKRELEKSGRSCRDGWVGFGVWAMPESSVTIFVKIFIYVD